jgi:UDP-N-acetylmuramate--alanine ligase
MYIQDKKDIPARLLELVRPGDIVITMGAGDIYQYGAMFIEQLEAQG